MIPAEPPILRASRQPAAMLTYRRLPLIACAIAMALTLPSLRAGFLFDDYHHKLLMSHSDSIVRLLRSPLDLFRFFDGDLATNQRLMDYGALPWWTYPAIRGAFWRPIASATHWLDYTIWPNLPLLMHLHSVLWYGAAVACVAVLYRRMMGVVPAAGLAAVLYAIDDAHGMPVGFLSNRSDLPAVAFGVLCLLAHHRWRREGWKTGAFLAPALLVASLLSKEAGVATGAYLIAYALFVDRGRFREQALSLIPCLAAVIAWRVVWSHLGYGVEELAIYVDPIRSPLGFLRAVFDRGPLLLMGLWALPPSDLSMVLSAHALRLLWIACVVTLLLLGMLLMPMLREHRMARFWACGMLLSILPACATFPSDRMLIFAGLGSMALLAMFLARVWERPPTGLPNRRRRKVERAVAVLLVVVHMIVAPVLLIARSGWPAGSERFQSRITMTQPPDLRGRDLIVINPPEAFGLLGSLLKWSSDGVPLPAHLRVLASSAMRPVFLSRPDAHTLVVRPEAGFMAGTLDRLFRGEWRPLRRGDRITLPGLTVVVTEAGADGRPDEASFQFSESLEDSRFVWYYWRDGHFLPFTPPAIGQQMKLGTEQTVWDLLSSD